MQNASKNGPTRVDIYDDIGSGDAFWGTTGVSAQDFVAQLASVKGELEVHINSAGGDVFEGIAIANAISGYAGKVTTIVDGLAASIASVIAQSGKHRVVQAGGMLMIHDAFGMCVGNESAMLDTAKTLAKVSDNLADMYAKRSRKGTAASWREKMRGETWYTAEEAVVSGLADQIGEQQAELPVGYDIASFTDVPNRIAARLTNMPRPRIEGNKALAVHHTGTVDTAWDSGAAKKGFKNSPEVLAYCHAWQDTSDGATADKKSSYKFPHHMTKGGPANLSACRNGLARLSDAKIPKDEKSGVEAHLRAHLADAGSDDAKNSLKWFAQMFGPNRPLSLLTSVPMRSTDTRKWNSAKVFTAGENADDPEMFFRATCAGRKPGDPALASSWALPWRADPSAKPHSDAVFDALTKLPFEDGIVNASEAYDFLVGLAKEIDPNFTEDDIDGRVLSAIFLGGTQTKRA